MNAEPRRTSDQSLPKRVGRYEAFLQIGAGGMARVYLAVQRAAPGQPAQSQLVVVKILRPEAVEDEHVLALFMDEARIAMRLQHPNVIRTREVIAEPPDYVLAMDFQNGQSLLHVLRRLGRDNVPLDEHIYILTKVLAGLSYAHELTDEAGKPFGIVHRDVSPANVLVSYTGEIKLLDFGIAKATGALAATQDGVVKGKLGYAAPEQCLGKPADPRSDVYAVGVMLWEAIAGRRRASGETWHSVLQARLDDAEPALEEVCPDAPEPLLVIARKALGHEPEARYATAKDFQKDLDAYLARRSAKITPGRIAAMLRPHFDQDRAEQQRAIEAYLNKARGDSGARRRVPLPTPLGASPKPAAAAPSAHVEEEQTSRIPVDAALLIMSRRENAAARETQSPPPASARDGGKTTAPPPPSAEKPTAPPPASAGSPAASPPPLVAKTTAPPPSGGMATAPPSSASGKTTAPPMPNVSFPPSSAASSSVAPSGRASTPSAARASSGDNVSSRPSAPSLSFAPNALVSLPPGSMAPPANTDAFGLVVSRPTTSRRALSLTEDGARPAKKKTHLWAVMLVVLGAAGIAAAGVLPLHRGARQTASPAPDEASLPENASSTAKPTSGVKVDQVKVRISVDPADAIIMLDGRVLEGNPFVSKLPKDNAMHELTASAEGYKDAKQAVHLNQDVDLLVALKRIKGFVRSTAPRNATGARLAVAHAPAAAPAPASPSPPPAEQPAPEAHPAAPVAEPGVNLQNLGGSLPKRTADEENPYSQ